MYTTLQMSKVLETLYVGSLDEAFDEDVLSNVHAILNVASELDLLPRLNHEYKKININDDDPTEDIRKHTTEAIEWMDTQIKKGNKVLVHCLEGRSRSVCICIAYLIKKQGYTYENAVERLRRCAKYYDPYPLYLEQLKISNLMKLAE